MKVYSDSSIPELEAPQCFVVQAEVNTGIVVTLNGNRKITDKPFIKVFDYFEQAEKFAKQRVSENPDIECNIYNHHGEYISTIFQE